MRMHGSRRRRARKASTSFRPRNTRSSFVAVSVSLCAVLPSARTATARRSTSLAITRSRASTVQTSGRRTTRFATSFAGSLERRCGAPRANQRASQTTCRARMLACGSLARVGPVGFSSMWRSSQRRPPRTCERHFRRQEARRQLTNARSSRRTRSRPPRLAPPWSLSSWTRTERGGTPPCRSSRRSPALWQSAQSRQLLGPPLS